MTHSSENRVRGGQSYLFRPAQVSGRTKSREDCELVLASIGSAHPNRRTTRPVVLVGHYGMSNFGDDFIMAVLMKSLEDALPGISVVPIGVQERALYPCPTFRIIPEPGLDWVSKRVLAALGQVASARAVVLGGGGVLQDAHTFMTVPRYAILAVIAALAGKPVLSYGIGVGPVHSGLTRILVNLILALSSLTVVRDVQSLAECRSFASRGSAIELGVDAAYLALRTEPGTSVARHQEHERIALSFGPLPDATFPLGAIVQFLQQIRKIYRVEYVVVPGSFHDWDIEVGRAIASSFVPPAEIRSEPLHLEEAISYWRQFKCVIGSKLHPLIVGSLACVPPLGIGGQRKVQDFVDSIYQETGSRTMNNPLLDGAVESFVKFWATLPERRAILSRVNAERLSRATAALDRLRIVLLRPRNRMKNRMTACLAAAVVPLLVVVLGLRQVRKSRRLHKHVVFGE